MWSRAWMTMEEGRWKEICRKNKKEEIVKQWPMVEGVVGYQLRL